MRTFTPPETPGTAIKAAGHRLIGEKGSGFTTQDLIKEAGVALQTFYRYFSGKDQLIIELITDRTRGHCDAVAAAIVAVDDPVDRLEFCIRSGLPLLATEEDIAGAQFVSSEHWRLHQLYPAEIWAATQPFVDLIRAELEAGAAAGTLSLRDPERDAWMINKTVVSMFHHYAFQAADIDIAALADDVCSFCLAAVGVDPNRSSLRALG